MEKRKKDTRIRKKIKRERDGIELERKKIK